MSEKTIKCSKLGKDLPALEKAPYPGELGQKIFENVSAQAWAMWQDMQMKVLNEYRLNLGDPKDYEVLMDQMMAFLNLKDGDVVEVENADRGMKGE